MASHPFVLPRFYRTQDGVHVTVFEGYYPPQVVRLIAMNLKDADRALFVRIPVQSSFEKIPGELAQLNPFTNINKLSQNELKILAFFAQCQVLPIQQIVHI